jgi:type IV pilus assembly protein PilM
LSSWNWKDLVLNLRNNKRVVSISDILKQKLSFLFDARQTGLNELVGLDIGPDRIKLLKIDSSSSPYQVVEYASASLPAGAIVKEEIKNPAAIGAVLREMLRNSGINAKFAAVAIPRTLAIIKNITVDARFSADDIEARAWMEANRLFPDLVGNIYLDFTITGSSVQVPNQLDLLLVACRKEHVKPYIDLVQQGGLTLKIIDVNCYALERALQLAITNHADLHTAALLNVNLTQSSLIVLENKQLIHAHEQAFDGQRLIKQVEDFITAKRAEPGMENAPIVVDDASYHAILQENFLSHLRHVINFFYSSRSHISIDKIILSGDCTIIPDFPSFIEKAVGIKTVMADPFMNMNINSRLNVDEIRKAASTLMLCSGLAMGKVGDKL